MHKKGLIGKLIFILFILIFILLVLTAYQIYDLVNTIKLQKTEIEKETAALLGGDCSKISSIEARAIILESKVSSACQNPLIYFGSQQVKELPYSCKDVSSLKIIIWDAISAAKEACDIKTLNNFTEEKIREYTQNISMENYQAYISQYNLSQNSNSS